MGKLFTTSNPEFQQPPWNTTLWRYLSLDKFFDLLFSESLFMTNIQKMSDKNEAVIPDKNRVLLERKFINETNDKEIGHKAFQSFIHDLEARKNSSYVNCWIMGPSENYALWKIYLGGGKQGVAIKTNTKKLLDSITSVNQEIQEDLYLTKVDYTNYIKTEISIEKLIKSKRNPYKYENEARIILLSEPQYNNGKQIIFDGKKLHVNTNKLIDEIYISPFGGKIFERTVRNLIETIKPEFLDRIRYSKIKDS